MTWVSFSDRFFSLAGSAAPIDLRSGDNLIQRSILPRHFVENARPRVSIEPLDRVDWDTQIGSRRGSLKKEARRTAKVSG